MTGTIFTNPALAKTFRLIQQNGRSVFYKGEIARAIVAKSNALGGTMTLRDLASYTGEWVTPASTSYHGNFTVYGTTAPSQAWGIIEALNILEQCVPQWYPGESLSTLGPANPLFWHALIETKKLAYADTYAFNADPDVVSVPVGALTSKPYAASLCSKINPGEASATAPPSFDTTVGGGTGAAIGGDTIYLSTADRWGNMVSWIDSNFAAFGSGITIPGYGFVLHNRGGLFTLDPKMSQRHRAAQTPLQYALGGVCYAGRQTVVDDRPARQRPAGHGEHAGTSEHPRPRGEPPGGG